VASHPQTLGGLLNLLHERDLVDPSDRPAVHHGTTVHDHVFSGIFATVVNEACSGHTPRAYHLTTGLRETNVRPGRPQHSITAQTAVGC
jgi:hypothetical protein